MTKEERVIAAFIKTYGDLAAGQMVLQRLLVAMAMQDDDPSFWLECFADRAKRHGLAPMPVLGDGDDPRAAIEAAAAEAVQSLFAGILGKEPAGDTIDARTDLIDDWPDIDGLADLRTVEGGET